MNKILKFAAIAAVAAALLLIGAGILLKSMLTPEMVRQKVIPILSQRLGRPVTVGQIEIGLLSGIAVKDVAVKDAHAKESLLTAKEASLGYDLLPLLTGRVVIDHVILKGPSVTIVRNPDGTLNISDLLSSKGPEKEEEGRAPDSRGSKTGAEGPLEVVVSRLSIENGNVTIIDRAVHEDGSGGPLTHRISDITLDIEELSSNRPFPFSLAASINGAPFRAKGMLDIGHSAVDLELSLTGLDAGLYSPYFAQHIPGTLSGPRLSLEASLKGTMKDLLIETDLKAQEMTFTPKKKDGLGIGKADARIRLNCRYLTGSSGLAAVEINESALILLGQEFTLTGALKEIGSKKGPAAAIKISGAGIDVAEILKRITSTGLDRLKEEYRPTGTLDLEASIQGRLSNLEAALKEVSVTFQNTGVRYSGQPALLKGGIRLKGKELASEALVLELAGQPVSVDLKVKDIWKSPIHLSVDLRSEQLDITGFVKDRQGHTKESSQAAAKEKGVKKAGSSPVGGGEEEPGPLDIPVDGKGTIRIGKLKYKGYEIDDLDLKWRLKNNKLTFDQNLVFAGGKIQKKGQVDLGVKGFRYDTDLKMERVRVQEFLGYLAPSFKTLVTGELNLDGRFSGRGVTSQSIRRNLSANGLWTMVRGVLRATGLMKGIGAILGLRDLNEIRFDNARGNFKVKDGVVLFRGAFKSKDMVLNPVGRMDLTGPISMDLNMKLSPELTSKLSSTARKFVITEKNGWSQVPLKVSGTLTSPKVSLSQRFIKQRLHQEADRFLKGLFGIGKKKGE